MKPMKRKDESELSFQSGSDLFNQKETEESHSNEDEPSEALLTMQKKQGNAES